MKRIIILATLAAVALSSMAKKEATRVSTNSSQTFELKTIIDNLPKDNIVGSTSEQGRDQLDSTFYLNAKVYEFPYNSKKEQKKVNEQIAGIIKAYDTDLPTHTGGYCSTNQLCQESSDKSKNVEIFYNNEREPLVIGGMGRNYAVLRLNDKLNPNYRHVWGIEWWLETINKKSQVVRFKAFKICGPLTKDLYHNAIRQSGSAQNETESDDVFKKYFGNIENNSKTREKETDNTKFYINDNESKLMKTKILGDVYKGFHNTNMDSSKRKLTNQINESIIAYLEKYTSTDAYYELCRVLKTIPGYYAQVIFADGESHKGDFSWLEKIIMKLDVSSVTWLKRGDPECVYSDKNQNVVPANFILKVRVKNSSKEFK